MSNETNTIDIVAIREAFEDYMKRSLRLDDEVLTAVIKRAGKVWEDFENADDPEKESCLFLEKAETIASQQSISDPGISALVARLDDEFYAAIDEDIEHVTKSKVSAVHILAQFRRLFNKQELNGLPYPGTDEEHVKGTNYRPDKVKSIEKGTGKPITTVWTDDFAATMPQGKKYDGILDNVKKENTSPGSIPAFKGKNEDDLEAIKSDANTRRNALRGLIRKSLALNHVWNAVEGMPLVGLRWIKGNKENGIPMPVKYGRRTLDDNFTMVTGAAKCIWIYDAEEPSKGRALTTTQFTNFNVADAIAAGGRVEDLIATANRGAKDTDDDTGDGEDMTEDQAMANMSQVVNYLNKRENMANVLRILADKKHDEHGDMVELIGDLYSQLYPVARKIRAEYETLKETKMEGFEKAA